MAVRIEDAGFEIRDMIAWVYGSGFPKSLNVSKAIDREAGELKPEGKAFTVAGYSHAPEKLLHTAPSKGYVPPPPATDAARQWQGWGTALKPALEPITMARKPLIGTVAENVLTHGTGALNIDGCRTHLGDEPQRGKILTTSRKAKSTVTLPATVMPFYNEAGRWPANLIHDGSEEVMELFPNDGESTAARFFYCPKADQSERGDGNNHPTVKPVDLMRYLVRLVTRECGTVLEPFGGSGTTAVACVHESCNCIIIERESQYVEIIRQRIAKATQQQRLF